MITVLFFGAVAERVDQRQLTVDHQPGMRLQDLHDVEANGSKADGDVLTYVSATGRWEAKTPAAGGIILESKQVISEDYTLTAGSNGLSQGPVDIAAGYTVTIPAGAVWGIL